MRRIELHFHFACYPQFTWLSFFENGVELQNIYTCCTNCLTSCLWLSAATSSAIAVLLIRCVLHLLSCFILCVVAGLYMEPILITWFFFFLSTCRGCKVLFTVSNIWPSLNCIAHHVNYSIRISLLKLETKYYYRYSDATFKREICTCFLFYKKRVPRSSAVPFTNWCITYRQTDRQHPT